MHGYGIADDLREPASVRSLRDWVQAAARSPAGDRGTVRAGFARTGRPSARGTSPPGVAHLPEPGCGLSVWTDDP